ncbi:MAG: ABC transporter substrate-binding protein [Lachnospiraceae bacterium]|nr:ABC transporter substrate-binding protein [Lachnospiraceae bacterium]MDY5742693.1 ABC transporter substrate-binding protein [Lachnospiraceae bacterium]
MRAGRRFSVLAVLLVCSLWLTGCRSRQEVPVSITLIHSWGGTEPDHAVMRSIYESFQKKYPKIRLQMISMPGGEEMLRKVEDMIMVGNVPDVVNFSGIGKNATYEFMINNHMAVDLAPFIKENSLFRDSLSQSNLRYWTTAEGELYSIADVLTLSGGYWYNETVFKEAGISELPKTWDEFLAMCERIRSWADTQGRSVRPLQPSAEGYLYLLDHMLGERTIGKQPFFSADLKKQLTGIFAQAAPESQDYSYRDETSLFNEGRLGIYINGVWGAQMIGSHVQARYALFPAHDKVATACESTALGYVVGKSGDERKEAAAKLFLEYMVSEEVQTRILQETEQIPANPHISPEVFRNQKPRLYQAATTVLGAKQKLEIPDNYWSAEEKLLLMEKLLPTLSGESSWQQLEDALSKNGVQQPVP